MIEQNILEKVIDKLMSGGADFAEIFVERKKALGIVCENKKIERITSGEKTGAGLRVVYGDRTYFAFSEDLGEEALYKLSASLCSKEQGAHIHSEAAYRLKTGDLSRLYSSEKLRGSLGEKVELLLHLNNLAWSDPGNLTQLMLTYGDGEQDVAIMNSNGVCIRDSRPRVKSIAQGIFTKDGLVQSSFDSMGALGDFGFIRSQDMDTFLLKVKDKGERLLQAKEAPSGTMPVVLSGEAGGTMVHEACGHGLEADIIKKGMSVYGGKVGTKVASELITVIDDGTIRGRYGSSCFDDEGTPTAANVLIENGVLKGYMSDLLSAKELGIAPSGNGRREGYHALPITRMTNTYIASGGCTKEEVLDSVSDGLFVKKMGGGQVNTATGDFVFEVSEGYLIKDGRLGEQVRGATLIGNGPDVLEKIDMVADDFGYSLGTCGKDGQGVPVADGQPTLRIPSLVVGGTK